MSLKHFSGMPCICIVYSVVLQILNNNIFPGTKDLNGLEELMLIQMIGCNRSFYFYIMYLLYVIYIININK